MNIRHRSRSAFTLVELLVVIGIMGILAAMLMGGILVIKTKAKVAASKALVRSVDLAVKLFEQNWDFFPPDHVADTSPVFSSNASFAFPGVPAFCDSRDPKRVQKENANILLTHMLLTTKKNGPFLEVNDKNLLTQDKWFFPPATPKAATTPEGKFLKKYASQFTTQPTSTTYNAKIYYIVDEWGDPIMYDLNSPETSNLPQFDSATSGSLKWQSDTGTDLYQARLLGHNTRTFDLYSWGENRKDDFGTNGFTIKQWEAGIVGTDQSSSRRTDDLTNWD